MIKRLLIAFAVVLPLPALAEIPESPARAAILVDADTGTTLYEKNADQRMPTASMSKLMTGYMVFEALKNGRLTLDTKVPISEHAWRQEGSRTYLDLNSQVRVEDLIKGMVIQSGNDAAVALAESIGGTEGGFASMATTRAHELGMVNSSFANATGLPDPNHFSTARDLATLASHVIHEYPQYYKYESELEFTYNNIRQQNRNPLLRMNIGADGVKTGHTDESGFSLIGSAVQNGRRLIVVVMGLQDVKERGDEAARLLQWGFSSTGVYSLLKAGDVLDSATVWMGALPAVPLAVKDDVSLTMTRDARRDLKAEVVIKEPVPAPVVSGMQLGSVRISAPGLETKEYPLYAQADVPELGFVSQITAKAHYMLLGGGE